MEFKCNRVSMILRDEGEPRLKEWLKGCASIVDCCDSAPFAGMHTNHFVPWVAFACGVMNDSTRIYMNITSS